MIDIKNSIPLQYKTEWGDGMVQVVIPTSKDTVAYLCFHKDERAELVHTLQNLRAQAIEESVKVVMSGSDDPMVKAYANLMRLHAKNLRGEK